MAKGHQVGPSRDLCTVREGGIHGASCGCDVVEAPKKLFYPKKMDPMVIHNLSAEHLCPEWFQGWWRENKFLRDFWIEGDFYIDPHTCHSQKRSF